MSLSPLTLNCDLGEGIAGEAAIIPFIDLASVACGGHFGNEDLIRDTLSLVKRFGKKAGAHPSYPDRDNFGRKSMIIDPEVLIQSLWEQIHLFLDVANSQNVVIDHIKFHGALYNDAAVKRDLALILVNFLKKEFPTIPLFVPPHSDIENIAKELKLPFKLEVFGDRAYQNNYTLVSRTAKNSLFTQKKQVISQMESIINHQRIITKSRESIPVLADTICIHGDNPGIMTFLPFIRNQFWR